MPVFELRLACAQATVEPLADALEALDALSVSVEDADAHTPAEQALFGEPGLPLPRAGWQRSLVTALFSDANQAQQAAALLPLQDFFVQAQVLGVQPLPDQDWVRLTQAQFGPVEITPAFWIVPTWHSPPAQAERVIRLDPGMAFGTGTHPTTRMCLRWIARHSVQQLAVLDYGCGSGILAIAAALHGASRVDALDIDPAAIEATSLNARANGVSVCAGLLAPVDVQYDLVLANILATPLKVLAPLLWARVRVRGHLVLAGILERQADELIQAYAPYGRLQVAGLQEGWVLMTAQR